MLGTIGTRLRRLTLSRYGLLAAALVLGALGGLGYWYRLEITSAYTSGRDAVLSTLALGAAPVAIWAAAFLWIVVARRRWLRRVNLLIASIALVAVILGGLSFFQPEDGALAVFIPADEEVSLGGAVGEAIAGPTDSNTAVRSLRVAAVSAVGAAIAAPRLAGDLAVMVGRLLVHAYVLAIVAVRALAGATGRLYRVRPRPAPTGAEPVEAVAKPPGPPASGEPDIGAWRPLDSRATPSPRPGPAPAAGRTVVRHAAAAPKGGALARILPGWLLSPTRPDRAVARVSDTPGASALRVARDSEPTQVSVTGAGTLEEEDAQREMPEGRRRRMLPEGDSAPPETQLEPVAAESRDLVPTGDEVAEVSVEPVDEEETDVRPAETLPVAARYNRYWADPAENGNGLSHAADPERDEAAAGGTKWETPPMDLLADAEEGGISDAEMADTAETIARTLADYGVEVEIGEVRPGPTVTMYGLVPGWVRRYKQVKITDEHGSPKLDESGKPVVSRVETRTRVKVDSILSREKDLSLALKTPSVRIETPVLGKALVGIEVPNPSPTLVTLRKIMDGREFKELRHTAKLPIPMGKGSGGETMVVDLARMPHLLVAGSTGSGKSVFLNTVVSCLLMDKTPEELRLLLVDPKRVELTPYNGIPHLLTPVVVETDQVVGMLKGLIREMLDRYRQMEEIGVRNIDSYNQRAAEKMPYLVLAIDELADLMMSASFDVEQSLCRLAQLGRATGIHLIVATQRPSVDVVTGLIKANFPSRVSFGVTSQIDSRTILDSAGAEKLLGRGDMLYLAVDASRPERVQGVFISDREIEDLVHFWQTTPRGPLTKVSLHTVGDGDATGGRDDLDLGRDADRDQLLDKAVELAYKHSKMSTSLLQRRLRIGYPRAARLMDQLEDEGIIGPSDGSKSRDVIITGA